MKNNPRIISKISRENLGLSKQVNLGKLPPQALDLEQSVLGALMIERQALTDVIDILKPNNFYKDSHKEIYFVRKTSTIFIIFILPYRFNIFSHKK